MTGQKLATSNPGLPRRTLWNVAWRYLWRHPWQSALMVLGIALGVAVVVAIDLANASASRAFDLSAEAVAGRATHQVVAGPDGLDESVYTRLRVEGGLQVAAPAVTEYVASPDLGNRPFQLLGVDPLAEAPFRSYLAGARGALPEGLTAFLTEPGAVLISSDVAARYRLATGASIRLDVAGHVRRVTVAGLLEPADDLSRRTLDGLILADVATAQELTGRIGKLDRIDLILPEGNRALADSIRSMLPRGARLQSVAARTQALEQMTAAFRTNLTALSLLALVVGMFLIYNTMTFSVIRRRQLFGTLRCLGVTRREVFLLVAGEALAVGSLGAALGIGLGILMGQATVRMVTQTINDLYFVLTVRGVELPVASLAKGGLLGVAATLLTAAMPAWEAASVPPRAALSRSGLESKVRQAAGVVAGAGGLVLLAGAGILALPSRNLFVSFAGIFAVIMGLAGLAPLATVLLMRGANPVTGRVWGVLGRMAPRDVVSSLSRTSVAVAALMVAVSVSIGVSLMVSSFRYTLVDWLQQTLQGDIYISAPSVAAAQESATIDPAAAGIVRGYPGVVRVDSLRSVSVDSPSGPVAVAAVDNPATGVERVFVWADRSPGAIFDALRAGAVIVSEPFANRAGLPRHGASVTLNTPDGPHTFPVIGVYYDYSSSEGTVLMALDMYRRMWHDDAVTALALRLAPGTEPDRVVRGLEDAVSPVQRLLIRPNRVLRQQALVIFDRTFAITTGLQVLATVVAFIGVLSALLSLQLEKQREMGILRAIGLTARQLWGLVMLETGLTGAVAGLLAMPTGFVLALILVYIINRRAFGWTLQMQVGLEPFVQALVVAVVAALLAGLYPAWRLTRMAAAEAVRFE